MKKVQKLIVILLIVNLLVSAGIITYLAVPADCFSPASTAGLDYEYSENEKYVLYIGTNDKDTYKQIIPTEDAIQKVSEICKKYVTGYTVSQSKGGWVDETGTLTEENTLVYSFSGVNESAIKSIMDEVLISLNQNSILVECQDITYTYYSK